jgi:hypothetical protein
MNPKRENLRNFFSNTTRVSSFLTPDVVSLNNSVVKVPELDSRSLTDESIFGL